MAYKVKVVETTLAGERTDTELETALERMLDKVPAADAKRLLQAAAAKPSLVKTALKFI
ncbi:MAG: hypothetical protein IJ911_12710 [Salinivirgaceae bacterium]|jgi:hypothetical protein|nr:hypothetical protein [Salinivirgaceae bacterium]